MSACARVMTFKTSSASCALLRSGWSSSVALRYDFSTSRIDRSAGASAAPFSKASYSGESVLSSATRPLPVAQRSARAAMPCIARRASWALNLFVTSFKSTTHTSFLLLLLGLPQNAPFGDDGEYLIRVRSSFSSPQPCHVLRHLAVGALIQSRPFHSCQMPAVLPHGRHSLSGVLTRMQICSLLEPDVVKLQQSSRSPRDRPHRSA